MMVKPYDVDISNHSYIQDNLYKLIQNNQPEGWEETETEIWIQLMPKEINLPSQGWKIHVSSLWYEAEMIAKCVMPVLIRHECGFKLVKNKSILRIINDCHYPMSGANKFFTCYPVSSEQFKEVMEELYEKLKGFKGPRIYTDMQCPECENLHYRYGAFICIAGYDMAEQRIKYYMRDEQGRLVEDVRKPWYQEPKGVQNPFRISEDKRFLAVSPKIRDTPLARYRLEKILSQANKGNVYEAVEKESGRRVIIKEARPSIAYNKKKTAISLLKNEYEILLQLTGKKIAPEPIEMFECHGNLYLVEEKIEGCSLTRYSSAVKSSCEKNTVSKNLVMTVNRLFQENFVLNDLSPNNIMVTPDMEIRLIDFENAGEPLWDSPDKLFATWGFSNPDTEQEKTPYSRDLFGMAMCILCLWLGTCVSFCKDEEGDNARLVVDKVLEQVCFAVEQSVISETVRNTVYHLIRQSSMKMAGKPVCTIVSGNKYPMPDYESWKISFEKVDKICLSFLKGLYHEAKNNLENHRDRLWDSTEFGRCTSSLNIQHGIAGIAGFLLEIVEIEQYADIANNILQLVDVYLNNIDVFQVREDNSLLFGNHGTAWFLYDFYRQRGDKARMEQAVEFARSLCGCQTDEQDYALGLVGWGCTYIKFWIETDDVFFLQKAVEIADRIYDNFTVGVMEKSNTSLKKINGIGFAHGKAGILYYLYLIGYVKSEDKYRNFVMNYMETYLNEVRGELDRYYLKSEKIDTSWCKGLAGIGTALAFVHRYEGCDKIGRVIYEITEILKKQMWSHSNCFCHGNAGTVEFLMDLCDDAQDDSWKHSAEIVAKYIFTQRFCVHGGYVRFTDETKFSAYYDYGTGAVGAMRAILRSQGYVTGRLYMVCRPTKLGPRSGETGGNVQDKQ